MNEDAAREKGRVKAKHWNAPDKWRVSLYSFEDEVRAGYDLPDRITIRDVTLYEGQHQPGVNFSLEGMIKIAYALYEIGIREIKQGASDLNALQFIKLIKHQLPDLKISLIMEVHRKYQQSPLLWKEALNVYVDAGIDEACFPGEIAWSFPMAINAEKNKDSWLADYAEAAKYARAKGIGVEFEYADCTRAALKDIKEFFNTGLKAGMTRIGVYDSYGVATPDAMKYLVSKLKKEFKDIPILVHAHNDFGSAEATTIGGILGGASSCDLSVNGLGDRAGNASLEEVVLQLEASYGVRTDLKLEYFLRLCRLLEEVTGMKTPDFKPIAGRNVFTNQAEVHARMILEQGIDAKYVSKAEAYSPHLVGGKRTVRFRSSSLAGGMIELRMDQIGLKYGEKELTEVCKRMRKIFLRHKADISLEEFDELAMGVCE